MEARILDSRSGRKKSPTRPGHRLRRKPPRVLLAEDDPADQDLVKRCIADRAIDLHVVASGTELLDYFTGTNSASRQSPDLILLDLNMPGKSGNDVLAQIRSVVANWVPVVVFSSSSNLQDVIECYEAGCSSYITKPIDFEAFRDAIGAILHYWLELSNV